MTESDANRDTSGATAQWYRDYYARAGADRNDLLRNAGVLFQRLAMDRAVLQALRHVSDLARATVLDVGCGTGSSLLTFLAAGAVSDQLSGIDILEERIAEARRRLPGCHFAVADAAHLEFADATFDVVFESTMFVQLTDERLAAQIAAEMLRVTRRGGCLLLSDWRYSKPGNRDYRGLSRARLARLFGAGCRIEAAYAGALIPPVGRRLSRWAPWAYFAAQSWLPLLAGHRVLVLRRTA